VDTLIQHPASLTHRPVAAEAKPQAALLRLAVGLEAFTDLRADLDQALGRLSAGVQIAGKITSDANALI
jgi:methionine-gamma-lyase